MSDISYARSRILEYFNQDILVGLNKLKKNKTIYNNNDKIKVALDLLDEYDVPYEKIGTGTNRLAILIDGYIFKIAMDDEGYRDNRNEFVVSNILYPLVLKCYETNGLISIYEYVTLCSMEDFVSRSSEILEILEDLSKQYLFGDIGYIKKNYQNWGYRDDKSLVILDYAYMYKISGHMLTCSKCGKMIRYTRDYSTLECPHCRSKYTFWDVRKGIDMQRIDNYIQDALENIGLQVNDAKTELETEVNVKEYKELSIFDKEERKGALRSMKQKFGMDNTVYSPWDARNPNSIFRSNRLIVNKENEPESVEKIETKDDKVSDTKDKKQLREESLRRVRDYILNRQTGMNNQSEKNVYNNTSKEVNDDAVVGGKNTLSEDKDIRRASQKDYRYSEIKVLQPDDDFGIYDEKSGTLVDSLDTKHREVANDNNGNEELRSRHETSETSVNDDSHESSFTKTTINNDTNPSRYDINSFGMRENLWKLAESSSPLHLDSEIGVEKELFNNEKSTGSENHNNDVTQLVHVEYEKNDNIISDNAVNKVTRHLSNTTTGKTDENVVDDTGNSAIAASSDKGPLKPLGMSTEDQPNNTEITLGENTKDLEPIGAGKKSIIKSEIETEISHKEIATTQIDVEFNKATNKKEFKTLSNGFFVNNRRGLRNNR